MERSVTVAEPTREPLRLDDAKKHLEIADADVAHDAHVLQLIVAAREQWEHDTQSLTVARNVTEKFASWPDDSFRFYYEPTSDTATVTYLDTDGNSQTLSTDVYSIDACNRRMHLKPDQDWPDVQDVWNAITVVYSAGPSSIKDIVRHAIRLQVDFMFELRGQTKEKDSVSRAYENLVARYMRGSYP